MMFEIPDNCGLCNSKYQIDNGQFMCGMLITKDGIDVNKSEVFLDTRPEWCPIAKNLSDINKMPEKDKILFNKIQDGLLAMFELINNKER